MTFLHVAKCIAVFLARQVPVVGLGRKVCQRALGLIYATTLRWKCVASCDANATAGELKGHNIASISLWPGAVWTEKIQTLTADVSSGVQGREFFVHQSRAWGLGLGFRAQGNDMCTGSWGKNISMTLARGCDVQDVKKNGEESKMQKIFGGGNTESTLYSGKAVAALAMDKKNLMG